MPTPAASRIAIAMRSPSTVIDTATRRLCSDGGVDHGAPVWRAWKMKFGSHGRKATSAPPYASSASLSRPRRSSPSACHASTATPVSVAAMKKSAQLCV